MARSGKKFYHNNKNKAVKGQRQENFSADNLTFEEGKNRFDIAKSEAEQRRWITEKEKFEAHIRRRFAINSKWLVTGFLTQPQEPSRPSADDLKDPHKAKIITSKYDQYARDCSTATKEYAEQYALLYNHCTRALLDTMRKDRERWNDVTLEQDVAQLYSLVCDTMSGDPAKVKSINPLVNEYNDYTEFLKIRQMKNESLSDFYNRWKEAYDAFKNKGLSLYGISTVNYPYNAGDSDYEDDADVDEEENKRKREEHIQAVNESRKQF